MFENGLLSTFIPEFLMVAVYVICLLFPGNKNQTDNSPVTSKIIHISNAHPTNGLVYKLTNRHFFWGIDKVVNQGADFEFYNLSDFTASSQIYDSDTYRCVHICRPPPTL